MVARVGPPLVGSNPTIVWVVTRGPLGPGNVGLAKGIYGVMGGSFTSLLQTIPPGRSYEVH